LDCEKIYIGKTKRNLNIWFRRFCVTLSMLPTIILRLSILIDDNTITLHIGSVVQ
ncbi:hypothetical protein L9F63_020036, partial [Diploptera punctata]